MHSPRTAGESKHPDSDNWDFPKIRGTILGGCPSKDSKVCASLFGPPVLGNDQILGEVGYLEGSEFRGFRFRGLGDEDAKETIGPLRV